MFKVTAVMFIIDESATGNIARLQILRNSGARLTSRRPRRQKSDSSYIATSPYSRKSASSLLHDQHWLPVASKFEFKLL